jgi:ribosomal protein L37E
MVQWPPEWQQKIIDALTAAGADRPCPRCGHEDFHLQDGYVSLPVQATLASGPAGNISTVVTVCEKCGYLSYHLLNVLLASDLGQPGGSGSPTR